MIKYVMSAVLLALSFSVQGAPVKNIDGSVQEVNLEAPGAPTLAVFWASWCGSCLSEIPHIKALHKQYPGLQIVGVNVNQESEDGLAIQKKYQLPYSSIADPELELADKYKVRGTPGLLLLTEDGRVEIKTKKLSKKLKKAIAAALDSTHEG